MVSLCSGTYTANCSDGYRAGDEAQAIVHADMEGGRPREGKHSWEGGFDRAKTAFHLGRGALSINANPGSK